MQQDQQEPERPHADVVLDIGEGVGALVLYTNSELAGQEIEISPKGKDLARAHTAVHERRVLGRAVFAGVFSELPEGDYRIWTEEPRAVTEFTIVGGQITEVDWRQ